MQIAPRSIGSNVPSHNVRGSVPNAYGPSTHTLRNAAPDFLQDRCFTKNSGQYILLSLLGVALTELPERGQAHFLRRKLSQTPANKKPLAIKPAGVCNPAAFYFPQPHGGSIISIIECLSETEIGKARVIIRTPAQWPAVFAI